MDGRLPDAAPRDASAETQPLPRAAMRLPPSRIALLLVDLQNYDAHPEYGLGPILREVRPEAAAYFYDRVATTVLPGVQRLLRLFRGQGERVVYCQSGALLPDGGDLSPRRRARFLGTADGRRTIFRPGEIEYEILQTVHPSPADVVVHKNTVSAFNSSNLDGVLRNMGIECLVVGGVVTDGCVDSTARDASDRGYDCVIVEDACAAWSPAWHVSALQAFERYFGLVSTTDDLARAVTTSREVSGGLADDRLVGVSDHPGWRAAPSVSGEA